MKYRFLLIGIALHFCLSLGLFLGLYGWAVGVQDAGAAAAPIGWVELPLRFVLLQPLAHWVLDAAAIAWWTWPGLGIIAVLFGLNSIVAVVAVRAVLNVRQWRGRSGRAVKL